MRVFRSYSFAVLSDCQHKPCLHTSIGMYKKAQCLCLFRVCSAKSSAESSTTQR